MVHTWQERYSFKSEVGTFVRFIWLSLSLGRLCTVLNGLPELQANSTKEAGRTQLGCTLPRKFTTNYEESVN